MGIGMPVHISVSPIRQPNSNMVAQTVWCPNLVVIFDHSLALSSSLLTLPHCASRHGWILRALSILLWRTQTNPTVYYTFSTKLPVNFLLLAFAFFLATRYAFFHIQLAVTSISQEPLHIKITNQGVEYLSRPLYANVCLRASKTALVRSSCQTKTLARRVLEYYTSSTAVSHFVPGLSVLLWVWF